jgi:N-methylhydantoinase B
MTPSVNQEQVLMASRRALGERQLDPVTFEVLKNAFSTIVDEMAEQILRSCHSFVIYNRDFSSALCDAAGDTIAQGSQDIAVHVGTLHFTAKAILDAFQGDINPDDVFAINDPYLGGTHLSDIRIVRPIFHDNELIAFAQSNGHWADVGGSVPGSFDVTAKEHFGEGLRVPPVRIWDGGRYLKDVARLIVSNTRVPSDAEGDLFAQAAATRVGETELLRLVERYGKETILQAFAEVQDYVELFVRRRLEEAPDGTWETEDYLDLDPASDEEGLIPVKVKMTIEGSRVHFDLTGSHGVIGSILNSGFGGTFSGIVGGMKTMFPDVPLNSGFFRPLDVTMPENTVVNALWPVAVSGFLMTYEKIMNCVIELWSELMPERAMACSYQEEYLLVGGRDGRIADRPVFMWYDWMVGGWGGRNGRDGANAQAPMFGVGLMVQPVEGQERLSPIVTTEHELLPDSGGPGEYRGGVGVMKGATLMEGVDTVMSYLCDRERSIIWGTHGGLPSNPMGVNFRDHDGRTRFLGARFSNLPLRQGDAFTRPSAGGGGFGDPLERDPQRVLEDVIDGYVTVGGAERDYGVVIQVDSGGALPRYTIDLEGTRRARADIREHRKEWLAADAEDVARRFRADELSQWDVVRRYGVILNWGTKELLPKTTEQFRTMLRRRAVPYWTPDV